MIEFSVVGRTDLQRRATVNLDGDVVLPLIGEIRASGLSLGELHRRISALFAPGQSVRPNDILLDLIETRPVYVTGDVIKPGAYPFSSNLTVLHAIALAGGMRAVWDNNVYALELDNRIATLRGEYVKQRVRAAALKAELAGRVKIDPDEIKQVVGASTAVQVSQLQARALEAEAADREQERRYLKRAVDLAKAQIDSLEAALKEDSDSIQKQVAEVQRIADLSQRGLSNPGRVAEEQRATSLLKSRQMDTSARLARARQDREELLRKLERVETLKLDLPKQLQDALLSLDGLRAQLGSVVAASASNPANNDTDLPPPGMQILRHVDGRPTWIPAQEDVTIEPGDLVKVTRSLRAGSIPQSGLTE